MSSIRDVTGDQVPTSSVLMAAAKHIGTKCRGENVAFLKCKKDDPNPEKCLDKGRQVTQCVLHLPVSEGMHLARSFGELYPRHKCTACQKMVFEAGFHDIDEIKAKRSSSELQQRIRFVRRVHVLPHK